MILGFSHVSLNASDAAAARSALEQDGFKLRAWHRDIPSAEEKWPLMARPARRHDLLVLDGTPVTEVICYDSGVVEGPTRLVQRDGAVGILARSPAQEMAFLREGLGFRPEPDVAPYALRLDSRFPQWSVRIALQPAAEAPLDPSLDVEGLGCLAFLSSDIQGDTERLIALGARDPTGAFTVTLGDRRLTVVLLRSPEGTIIELLEVQRAQ